MFMFLIIFTIILILFIIFINDCTNQKGHHWELINTYKGNLNYIEYYRCRHCGKERNEGWYMKKT